MKTIICLVSLVLTVTFGNAQTATNSKVSINHSNTASEEGSYKVNISISNTDKKYTLDAKFPFNRTEKLKQFFNDHLRTKMIQKESTTIWKHTIKEELGYSIKLKKGRLNITMDKQSVPSNIVMDVIKIIDDAKEIIKKS